MFVAMAFTVMTMVADTSGIDQKSVSQEEIEILSQLEFLEAWDILKTPAMDQEMEVLPSENKEEKKQ